VAIQQWRDINAGAKTTTEVGIAPDANDEYLLYQALVGAAPLGMETLEAGENWTAFRDRIAGYMAKATKEAKVHTSWTNPNAEYDRAVADFVSALLEREGENAFVEAFLPFQKRIAYFGQWNSLSQTLLRLTCPGVPDTYRGTEVWDYSLVDPDNRRPVDYDSCRALLAQITEKAAGDRAALADDLVANAHDGRIKLYVVTRALHSRRERPDLFHAGLYQAISARGENNRHVCAFRRSAGNHDALIVVPRLVAGLADGVERPPTGDEVWGDTWLVFPEGEAAASYANAFTGETLTTESREGRTGLPLSAVLRRFPVALLERV
jgi:(1->4)-alpha-D-glucan 1-alpha-D-glucosylmutase